MSYVRLTLVFLLLLLAVLFAFSNKELALLTLWPTPWKIQLPLSVVVLGAMFLAFFGGVASRFFPGLALRRRLKRAEKELETLRSDLLSTAQQLAAARQPPPPPMLPPMAPPQPPYA